MSFVDRQLGGQAGMQPEQPQQPAQPGQQEAPGDAGVVIQQMRDEWMAKTPDNRRDAVERLVTAGQKVMFDPKTHDGIMKQFQAIEAQNDTHRIAVGIGGLMQRLAEKSKGPLPVPALVPAAAILSLDALEFLGEAGMIEVSTEIAKQVVLDTGAVMSEKLGVGTPEKLSEVKSMMSQTAGQAKLPSQAVQQGPAQPQPGAV